MSLSEAPQFGKGMENADETSVFYRSMLLRFKNSGVEFPKNGKFLEVGGGNGNLLAYMKSEKLDAVGVDVEPRSPDVQKADAVKLPYADASFDCVISKQVFDGALYPQSEGQQEAMLREIARVLKSSGYYYAAEWLFVHIDELELASEPGQITSIYRKQQVS